MASPITWRNVNSNFDVRGAAKLMDSASANINSAFTGLGDILKNAQGIQDTNRQTQIDTATNEFLNKLQGMSPEQLQQSMQDGSIAALRDSYGAAGLNRDKTNAAAVQSLLASRQNQALANQQYQDQQAERAAQPQIAAFYNALNSGDTNHAAAVVQNVPDQLKIKLMSELDKVQDTDKLNQAQSLILNKDFDAANKLLNSGGLGDTTKLQASLFNARKQDSANNLYSLAQGFTEDLNQQGLAQEKALNDYGTSIGIPVVNGSLDFSNATQQQINQYNSFEAKQPIISATKSFNEKMKPLLAKHTAQYGDFELGNQLSNTMQNASYGLNPIDLEEIDRRSLPAVLEQQQKGNIYFKDGAVYQPEHMSATDMLAQVNKANPNFANVLEQRPEIAEELMGIVNGGLKVGNETIRLPSSIVMDALNSTKVGEWLRADGGDRSLTDVLSDFAKENNISDDWKEYENFQSDKAKLTDAYRRNAGLARKDYRASVNAQVDNRAEQLEKAETQRIALEKALKNHREGQSNDQNLIDEPLDRFRIASGAFDFSPVVLPEKVKSNVTTNPASVTPVVKKELADSLKRALELKKRRDAARS